MTLSDLGTLDQYSSTGTKTHQLSQHVIGYNTNSYKNIMLTVEHFPDVYTKISRLSGPESRHPAFLFSTFHIFNENRPTNDKS